MNTLINTKYLIFAFLSGLLLFTGCKRELFSGSDNFIASFSLKQGEMVINASIEDNIITIKAPEGLSLNGATALIKLSENTNIYPNPSTITDWNDEMTFAVTAYNGTQTRYKYIIVRNHINESGTVVLETQADVNAFGEKGITAVGGNLVIGRVVGIDSITTLAPLSHLKEIAYSLIIYPTYCGNDLSGLENLEKVGLDIHIDGAKNIKTAILSNLKEAGAIYIKNDSVFVAEFPMLKEVTNEFTMNCPLTTIYIPNLKTVGGTLTITSKNGSDTMLPKISCPSLEESGNITFTNFKNVVKVELPELKRVGSLDFAQMTMLSVVIASKLEVSTGTITAPSTPYYTEVCFPSLTELSTMKIDSKTIRVLDLPKLKTVTTLLSIRNAQIDGITNMVALEDVKGEFIMYELAKMPKFSLPASLRHIKKLTIERRNAPVFDEINIKGVKIEQLKVAANAIRSKIIADDLFQGTLIVASSGASNNKGYPSFPILEGFHEVDSLSLEGYVSAMDTVHIRSIKKINKGFRLENNNIKRFSMPDLEEIGGDFYFARLEQSVDETLDFAKLKKIGGNFEFAVGSPKTRTLRFSALESIGGNFTLSTGSNSGNSLENILFPVLKTIGGKMLLKPYNSNPNLLLRNLDGFAMLKSVQSIEIINQMALISFEGLKMAFPSINTSNWKVSGNNYNPTYEDLQNNKWVKP